MAVHVKGEALYQALLRKGLDAEDAHKILKGQRPIKGGKGKVAHAAVSRRLAKKK